MASSWWRWSLRAVGLLCVLAGFFAKGGLRIAVAVVLVLVSFSGVVGVYQHYESRSGGEEAALLQPQAAQAGYTMVSDRSEGAVARAPAQEGDESGEGAEGGGGEVPPPLAPLSIAGVSLMAALVIFAKEDKAVVAGR